MTRPWTSGRRTVLPHWRDADPSEGVWRVWKAFLAAGGFGESLRVAPDQDRVVMVSASTKDGQEISRSQLCGLKARRSVLSPKVEDLGASVGTDTQGFGDARFTFEKSRVVTVEDRGSEEGPSMGP